VYTLDSKLAGDTTLEVKVLRARNLAPFGKPGVEGYACNVEVEGGSLNTPVLSGTSPVWECPPFTFCVHEDPWPVTIHCSIISHGRKIEGGKDAPTKLKVGVGELVLHGEQDLGSERSCRKWVNLHHYRPPRLTDDQEEDEDEWKKAELDSERMPAVYLLISYSASNWEGVPESEARKFHANSEETRREMVSTSVHHSASFRKSARSLLADSQDGPEEPPTAGPETPPDAALHAADQPRDDGAPELEADGGRAPSDDMADKMSVSGSDAQHAHTYHNGRYSGQHLRQPTHEQYQELNDRRLEMAANLSNSAHKRESKTEQHAVPPQVGNHTFAFPPRSPRLLQVEQSPRAVQLDARVVAGRQRKRPKGPENGQSDAASVTSEGSAVGSVARSYASRGELRRAAVERIDLALSSGDFPTHTSAARFNGLSSHASSNGAGSSASRRRQPSAPAPPQMLRGVAGRAPDATRGSVVAKASADTVIVPQVHQRQNQAASLVSQQGRDGEGA